MEGYMKGLRDSLLGGRGQEAEVEDCPGPGGDEGKEAAGKETDVHSPSPREEEKKTPHDVHSLEPPRDVAPEAAEPGSNTEERARPRTLGLDQSEVDDYGVAAAMAAEMARLRIKTQEQTEKIFDLEDDLILGGVPTTLSTTSSSKPPARRRSIYRAKS